MNNKPILTYKFVDLTLIQIGSVLALPIIMLGFMLTKQCGPTAALFNIFFGNGILTILALPISIDILKTRGTSSQRIANVLGVNGSKLSALALCLVLVGWFAINLHLISDTILNLLQINESSAKVMLNSLVGIFIIITVINGIEKIKLVSKYSIPLFCLSIVSTITYLWLNYQSGDKVPLINLNSNVLFVPSALLVVLTASFTMLFDLPTYYRLSASKKDSILSIVLVFTAISVMESLGIIFAILSNTSAITEVFTSVPITPILLLNLVVILAGGWSVNNGNLYVSSTNLAIIFPNSSTTTRVVMVGLAATLLSYFNILDNFATFLNGISIVIASITALLLLDSLKVQKTNHPVLANIAVLGGITLGVSSLMQIIKLYDFAFLEAALSTIVFYELLVLFAKIINTFKSPKQQEI